MKKKAFKFPCYKGFCIEEAYIDENNYYRGIASRENGDTVSYYGKTEVQAEYEFHLSVDELLEFEKELSSSRKYKVLNFSHNHEKVREILDKEYEETGTIASAPGSEMTME